MIFHFNMKTKKGTTRPKRRMAPKDCYFCTEGKSPSYKETEVLHRYITDRGKIMARLRTGICSMHQRQLTIAIKHARHLALLPFIVR